MFYLWWLFWLWLAYMVIVGTSAIHMTLNIRKIGKVSHWYRTAPLNAPRPDYVVWFEERQDKKLARQVKQFRAR